MSTKSNTINTTAVGSTLPNIPSISGGNQNNNAQLDLVQIRWQQIRETEFFQKVQTENYDLKQEIIRLQKLLKEKENAPPVQVQVPVQSDNPIHQKLLKTFVMSMQKYNQYIQKEMEKIKEDVSKEMSYFFRVMNTLFLCNKKALEINKRSENVMVQIRDEKQEMRLIINELENQLQQYQLLHSSEANTFEKRMEKIALERDEWKKKFQESQELNEQLKTENTQLKKEKEEFNHSYLSIKEMNEKLLAEIQQLQIYSDKLLLETSQTQKQIIDHYEGMVEQMALDNQYLQNRIQELEDQISKLTQSLVGNKSHFAKYVEVKTENIALQSKLNTLLKNPKPNHPNLPSIQNQNQAMSNPEDYGKGQQQGQGPGQSQQTRQIPPLPFPSRQNSLMSGNNNSLSNQNTERNQFPPMRPHQAGVPGPITSSSARGDKSPILLSPNSNTRLSTLQQTQSSGGILYPSRPEQDHNHPSNMEERGSEQRRRSLRLPGNSNNNNRLQV